jgi:DNA-binding FrmR family transcriptional regulator
MAGYVTDKDALRKRLRRVEGQIRGLQRMVEEERYCIEIVTQIAAARTALERVALTLLDDHVRHCIADGGDEKIAELMDALERFTSTR